MVLFFFLLQITMYCPFCGHNLHSETAFCSSCGKNVKFMYDADKPGTSEGNISKIHYFLIRLTLSIFSTVLYKYRSKCWMSEQKGLK